MHAGYELVYVDELMGKGLTPADFKAYKSQRYRWAFGAMQILKGRWQWMTQKGPLSAGQRFHFLTGWLFGFGYFVAGLWWLGHALLIDADEFAWALPLISSILGSINSRRTSRASAL